MIVHTIKIEPPKLVVEIDGIIGCEAADLRFEGVLRILEREVRGGREIRLVIGKPEVRAELE